jgi:hypothetical protein
VGGGLAGADLGGGGTTGLGHLLAQQLVAAGEAVLDIQPKVAARGAAAGVWEHQQEQR